MTEKVSSALNVSQQHFAKRRLLASCYAAGMVMLTSKEHRRRNFALMVAKLKRDGKRSKDIAMTSGTPPRGALSRSSSCRTARLMPSGQIRRPHLPGMGSTRCPSTRTSLRRKGLSPNTLSVVFGRGDSMLPRIRDGDAILFDTSDKAPRDGRIYVVQIDGPHGPEYSAKRCVEILGRIAFEAINPDGDHQWSKPRAMDDPKRPIQILGRVRWIGSWED